MELKKMNEGELIQELSEQKAREDEAYQLFTRCAASRAAAHVKAFSEAATIRRAIKEELRRRKTRERL